MCWWRRRAGRRVERDLCRGDRCGRPAPSPGDSGTVGGPSPYWQPWSYDAAGDRATQTDHDTSGNTSNDTTTCIIGSAVIDGIEWGYDSEKAGCPLITEGVADVATLGYSAGAGEMSGGLLKNPLRGSIKEITQGVAFNSSLKKGNEFHCRINRTGVGVSSCEGRECCISVDWPSLGSSSSLSSCRSLHRLPSHCSISWRYQFALVP